MRFPLREQLGFLTLLAFAGSVVAAENLPLLRVDPALLGGPSAVVTAAPAANVTAVPAAIPPPQTPSAALPGTEPEPQVKTAAAPPQPAESSPVKRVDPVLLGTQDLPAATPVVAAPAAAPPDVTSAPTVPPLYSAHAAAGLLPAPAGAATGPSPTFVTADHIQGQTGVQMQAEGKVELRRDDSTLNSDTLIYREPEDEVEASGNVRLTRGGDRMSGPHMKLKLDDSTGFFETPTYAVTRLPLDGGGKPAHAAVTGHGTAKRLEFEGEDRYRLSDATYSTCPAGSGDPDWFARAADLALDYSDERATARNATLVFKGVPILYSPWLSFSLNNQRQSGFLAPNIGSTSQGGPEFTVPYYWNIAPDKDATVALRSMSKRGQQWQGEYRYMGANYRGQANGEYLGDDKIFRDSRSALSIVHEQNFGHGFSGNLNLNRVSDDTYFSDLSTRLTNVSQTNLVRQGNLSYSGGWWNANVMAQRYQTLQDPAQPPVAIPYDRLPQATLTATRPDLPFGLLLNFQGEYVSFDHPTSVLGKRTTLYPQLSLPYQTAAFYLTPKIGFSSTRYELERQAPGVPDRLARDVPIMSVDSGLTFERATDWFGRDLTQTLEPRLYYLHVPYRDQSRIPVFDSGLADFNFAQIFSENIFTGGDRIADANQATAALTSRLVDPDTGAELLKATVGERYYFTNQNVTLPGVAQRTRHVANLLAALSGTLLPDISFDSAFEYNTRDSRFERYNLGARYQPELGKVLNAGYRYTRNLLDQVDVSAQWPLAGGWYGVGRYNYSIREKRVVESIAGLEYNGGCWVARVVVQRLATAIGRANSAFFFQLELNDFSKIGANPLDLLKRNIPGYGRINESDADAEFPANP